MNVLINYGEKLGVMCIVLNLLNNVSFCYLIQHQIQRYVSNAKISFLFHFMNTQLIK